MGFPRQESFCSFTQSCPTLSNPMGLQHTRIPGSSVSQRVCSNTCPLSWWCHPTISSSVTPSLPALSLSQHQSFFQWVGLSHQVAKVLELQLQCRSFQWMFRVDFLSDWLVWSPCYPRNSQESSPAPQFKSINSSVLSLLYGPTLLSICDYWENISKNTSVVYQFLLQEIFPTQGLKLCLLHWKLDSLPLSHLGDPSFK